MLKCRDLLIYLKKMRRRNFYFSVAALILHMCFGSCIYAFSFDVGVMNQIGGYVEIPANSDCEYWHQKVRCYDFFVRPVKHFYVSHGVKLGICADFTFFGEKRYQSAYKTLGEHSGLVDYALDILGKKDVLNICFADEKEVLVNTYSYSLGPIVGLGPLDLYFGATFNQRRVSMQEKNLFTNETFTYYSDKLGLRIKKEFSLNEKVSLLLSLGYEVHNILPLGDVKCFGKTLQKDRIKSKHYLCASMGCSFSL